MGKQLVPLTMIAALLGLAGSALTIGFVPDHPTWWRAAVSLAVLGGITTGMGESTTPPGAGGIAHRRSVDRFCRPHRRA